MEHAHCQVPDLKRSRQEVALTQRELAQFAGLHVDTVWRAEQGNVVTHLTARKLVQAIERRQRYWNRSRRGRRPTRATDG